MKNISRIISVFDFDHTLINRDSLLPFLIRYFGMRRCVVNFILLLPSFIRFLLGRLSRQDIKECILKIFFEGISYDDVEKKGKEYAEKELDSFLKPKMIQKFHWHKEQGHYCVIVSASPEFYVIPWGERQGFDRVIASKLEVNADQKITGRLQGMNCWGEEKLRRFLQEFPRETWDELFVYGDSEGDRALLKYATYPFYRSHI